MKDKTKTSQHDEQKRQTLLCETKELKNGVSGCDCLVCRKERIDAGKAMHKALELKEWLRGNGDFEKGVSGCCCDRCIVNRRYTAGYRWDSSDDDETPDDETSSTTTSIRLSERVEDGTSFTPTTIRHDVSAEVHPLGPLASPTEPVAGKTVTSPSLASASPRSITTRPENHQQNIPYSTFARPKRPRPSRIPVPVRSPGDDGHALKRRRTSSRYDPERSREISHPRQFPKSLNGDTLQTSTPSQASTAGLSQHAHHSRRFPNTQVWPDLNTPPSPMPYRPSNASCTARMGFSSQLAPLLLSSHNFQTTRQSQLVIVRMEALTLTPSRSP